MKTKSQLTDFYYKDLYPKLQELEERRIKLKKKLLSIGSFFAILVLLFLFYVQTNHLPLDTLIFGGAATLFIFAFFYRYLTKDYALDFKYAIIEPLIKEIQSNFHYSPNQHILKEYFLHAHFFTTEPDRVSGNDYVHGSIDGVKIKFSDFHAEVEHKDSRDKQTWSTLFQGIFAVTEFPKYFQGSTVVLPDSAENIFGEYLGTLLQKTNFSREQLIKMDNPAFEKEFVVYGTDQIEARYILTPAFMEKILKLKKRSNVPLYLSFRSNTMYLGIAYNKDMFEPSVFRSLLEYKISMEYIDTLHMMMGLVDELKLNQKLWSKL